MKTKLNPYLNFKDDAREAMEFYKTVFGGELDLNTFKDFGGSQDSSENDMIMHSVLETDNGLVLMGADTPARLEYKPGTNNFSISLSGDNEAELRSYFEKLSEGGTITLPLQKANWGDTFGMLKDKFDVSWLVNISASSQANG